MFESRPTQIFLQEALALEQRHNASLKISKAHPPSLRPIYVLPYIFHTLRRFWVFLHPLQLFSLALSSTLPLSQV